jgi:hypothetical protein
MQADELKSEVKSPVGKAVLGPAGKILTFFFVATLPVLLLWLLWARLPDAMLERLEPGLRWAVAAAGIAASFLTARSLWPRKGVLELLSFSLLGVAALFMLGSYLQLVSSYPFKLSWSEGNRFYDYSLIFGKYLYQAETPPELFYNDPGRYGLWGILFAVPGLPVWVHRLWNALLFTSPCCW